MSEKIKVMRKWFDYIKNDPNVETTEQEMAYIMYATLMYGLYEERVNLGEVFGEEFKQLNRSMPNIYDQIDSIKNYDPANNNGVTKYDDEAIKECRLKGMTGKEICMELGYPLEKERSLSSTKGWREAREILKKQKAEGLIQKSVKSVKVGENDMEKVTKNTENTDFVQPVKNTESTDSVQNLQKSVLSGFDF